MLGFKSFLTVLLEGGNIRVKTANGEEVSAAPFKVKDRGKQTQDIHAALKSIHDSYNQATGAHLFGRNGRALETGSAFAGSTRHLMNGHIPDHEFKKHKPTVGDVDAQVPMEHKDALAKHLKPGDRHGPYTVVGVKKHGNEASAVMRHDNGEHHQFDFEGTHYKGDEPHKDESFLHSADWNDAKAGISGAHHKILLNAVGLGSHKFSISNGLRSRTDDSDPGTKNPQAVSTRLFGKDADHDNIHSFQGAAQLIRNHIHPSQHQAIYDKFKAGLKSVKKDHGPALEHLLKQLNVTDSIKESVEETHQTSVISLGGFVPFSHIGHRDLGEALKRLPGTKHIGISSKSTAFSPEERKSILDRQWSDVGHTTHIVSGAGETIRRAYDSLPSHGRKVLHLLAGGDRQDMAAGLKRSLEQGKIREMEHHKFDEIHIHAPADSNRTHGMSGTRMRQAAADGNEDEFHRHIGSMFTRDESNRIMGRVKTGIQSGAIPLKR